MQSRLVPTNEISMLDFNSYMHQKNEYERQTKELSACMIDKNIPERVKELIRNTKTNIDTNMSKDFLETRESLFELTKKCDILICCKYFDKDKIVETCWDRRFVDSDSIRSLSDNKVDDELITINGFGSFNASLQFIANKDYKHYRNSIMLKDSVQEYVQSINLSDVFYRWFEYEPSKIIVSFYKVDMIKSLT